MDGIWVRGKVARAASGTVLLILPMGNRPKFTICFTGWGVGTQYPVTNTSLVLTIISSTGTMTGSYAANTHRPQLDLGSDSGQYNLKILCAIVASSQSCSAMV